jgi:hypothetical protein
VEDRGGLERVVKFRGQSFQKSSDMIVYLQAVEDDKDRYIAQIEVLKTMVIFYNRTKDMIKDVFTYVKADGAFKVVVSHDEFNHA